MDRKRTTERAAVVAGSVWETRMKNDQIMGGFKVFNAADNKNPEEPKQRTPKQSPIGKRKTWKSDNSIQIGGSVVKKSPSSRMKEVDKSKSKLKSSNFDDGEEIQKSPVRDLKMRSEEAQEMGASVDESEGNPVQISDEIEKKLDQVGEMKTESVNVFDESKLKTKSGSQEVLDEPNETLIGSKAEKLELKKGVDESIEKIEQNPVEIEKNRVEIEEIRSNLGEEQVISSSLINMVHVKSASKLDGKEEDLGEEIEVEREKQSIEVEEIKSSEEKPKQIVKYENKLNQKTEKPLPIVKKQSPNLVNYSKINSSPAKTKAIPDFDGFQSQSNPQRVPETHGKLQSLIDLVMWRDASRSTFIFGIGAFIIISSSYTKDLNISLISVFSYLGLVYLAATFIFRSIIFRGVVDLCDTSEEYYIVGEEEAVWLLRMVLPYLNEFLIKIKSLFCGDPATTMKLAMLLFVLARCGSSITIWKMAKLGFFGMFIVPKICSSYSAQLTAYGKFWVRRFRDAWESCSHKKAVAFGIFALVWNLSSVVARIWAVFMLFVAFRYYQQSMILDNDCAVEEEKPKCEPSSRQGHAGARRIRRAPANVEKTTTKEKKKF